MFSFDNTPIIGMIHLAGDTEKEIISRAQEELDIYKQERVTAAIVENYHCKDLELLEYVVAHHQKIGGIPIGVNVLPNEFGRALRLARRNNLEFIQLDYVSGKYEEGELDYDAYLAARAQYPGIAVLGGVHPKYYHPVEDSNLTVDLNHGIARCEAIVVTGSGTGKQTPMQKILDFKRVIGKHPLIVGAGVDTQNIYEQLGVANGAIIGSAFKPGGHTTMPVEAAMVRAVMTVVDDIRYARQLH